MCTIFSCMISRDIKSPLCFNQLEYFEISYFVCQLIIKFKFSVFRRLDFHGFPPYFNHLPPTDNQNKISLTRVGTFPDTFRTFVSNFPVNRSHTATELLDVRISSWWN